jgi:hypothetical protein
MQAQLWFCGALLTAAPLAQALRPPDGYSRDATECAACIAIATELRDAVVDVLRPLNLAKDSERRDEVLDRTCKRMANWTRDLSDGTVRYSRRSNHETLQQRKARLLESARLHGEGAYIELKRELRDHCATFVEDHEERLEAWLLRLSAANRLDGVLEDVCVHIARACTSVPKTPGEESQARGPYDTNGAPYGYGKEEVVEGEEVVEQARLPPGGPPRMHERRSKGRGKNGAKYSASSKRQQKQN